MRMVFILLLIVLGSCSDLTDAIGASNSNSNKSETAAQPEVPTSNDGVSSSIKDFSAKTVVGLIMDSSGVRLLSFSIASVATSEADMFPKDCEAGLEAGVKRLRESVTFGITLGEALLNEKVLPKEDAYEVKIGSATAAVVTLYNKSEVGKQMTSGTLKFKKKPTSASDSFTLELDVTDGKDFLKGEFTGKMYKVPECE